MQVRRCAQTRCADVRHRPTDAHVGADVYVRRETAQMPVARHVAIAMTNFEHVAVTVAPAPACDDPVPDRTHRRALVRSVVGALVLTKISEDRVLPQAEEARD